MRYDYECPICGPFEFEKKMSSPDLAACPRCGSSVRRIYNSFAVLYANRPTWTYNDCLKYKTCSFKGGRKTKVDSSKHGDIGAWNCP